MPETKEQLAIILKDILEVKQAIREIKKDIKAEEHNNKKNYVNIKKSIKEMTATKKDIEHEFLEMLEKDEAYITLKKMRVSEEEKLANFNQKLFQLIAQLPQQTIEITVQTATGPRIVRITPRMHVEIPGEGELK